MAFLGVFIYAGIGGEWVGLRSTVDSYYEETNLANLWLYGKGFSEEDAEEVSKVDGVTGVERRLTLGVIGDFENSPTITLHFMEEKKISKAHLIEGEEFDVNKDGVWLDNLFAEAKGLNVGDERRFKINGMNVEKKILGTILSPEYV